MTTTPKDPVDALMALAKECGATVYAHRTSPHEPAVAFSPSAWEAFSARALAAVPAQVELDGRLHADGYFTWNKGKRPDYIADRGLPCDFYLDPPIAQQAGGVPAEYIGLEKAARIIETTKQWRGGGWVSTLSPETTAAIAATLRAAAPSPSAVQPLSEAYNELLFSVGNKYPGETRHQTALRYIRQAEQSSREGGVTPKEPT